MEEPLDFLSEFREEWNIKPGIAILKLQLTSEVCTFWHLRRFLLVDGKVEMRMEKGLSVSTIMHSLPDSLVLVSRTCKLKLGLIPWVLNV